MADEGYGEGHVKTWLRQKWNSGSRGENSSCPAHFARMDSAGLDRFAVHHVEKWDTPKGGSQADAVKRYEGMVAWAGNGDRDSAIAAEADEGEQGMEEIEAEGDAGVWGKVGEMGEGWMGEDNADEGVVGRVAIDAGEGVEKRRMETERRPGRG